jgi:periplasmic protein TonB
MKIILIMTFLLGGFYSESLAQTRKIPNKKSKPVRAKIKPTTAKKEETIEDLNGKIITLEKSQLKIDRTEAVLYHKDEKMEISARVDVLPEFPGGQSALSKFISENMKYPPEAIESQISGTVMVFFEVDTTGKISNIKILESAGRLLDREAIRVVKLLPNFIPAMYKYKPVSSYFRLPLTFGLTDH